MAILDFFKDKDSRKETLPFADVKRKILEDFDVDHVNVKYDCFPKEFDRELERAYISQIVQTRRGHVVEPVKGKENQVKITRHYIFTGNPGVGKSTAARLMGYVFQRLGILNGGKFVEVSRTDLVGEAIGVTESKTEAKLKEAKNGILFINEANQLMVEDSKDYGKRALQQITRFMEDNRNEIVVIIDGLPAPINELFVSNPGLRDRFSRPIHFSDYNDSQLLKISKIILGEYQYYFEEDDESVEVFETLIKSIRFEYQKSGKEFANFRTIRNYLDLILDVHNQRLFMEPNSDADKYKKITRSDIEEVQKMLEKN